MTSHLKAAIFNFYISTKPFTAVEEIIENLQKLTVMWSLNVKFLVDNTDISEIV